MVLEGVGFLGREGKLEEVAGLKTCMERSFLSLCEVVGPGDRVAFERDKGAWKGKCAYLAKTEMWEIEPVARLHKGE